ncbi:MAG: hypothetical protein CMQ41_15005 [Gammaproteobacteria bacterium]|nr:hypothetical protein [Gammaproteobacteria bacterium]MBM89674.1 hypothetical protein [Gammaproteobacteria bacterium]|tara:strand:+ start:1028 stop:1489 length:462 start_codon:yes stop_codon:yes gene_type:complete
MPTKTSSNSTNLCVRAFFFITIFLVLSFWPLYAAEEVLLKIEGDLIDEIEITNSNTDANLTISSYYELLPSEIKTEIADYRSKLDRLQPDYEVAFLAADSAEMAEVREEIDGHWLVIQTIHNHFFTAQVVEILNRAYIKSFDGLLPEESNTLE